MRVLVSGATGFVGSHLVPALLASGHEVIALVRQPSSFPATEGATVVGADLERLDEAELPDVEAVVHLAQANVPFPEQAETLYRVNTESTLALLDHARRARVRAFVYASSASVYGYGDRPFTEDDPPASREFYAVTKLNGEQLVAAYGRFFSTTVFRLVAPYGPGQRGRMIPAVIGRVREGRPVTLNGGGRPRMNPIFVEDAVRAAVAALELGGNHVVNVAGDQVVGIDDIARLAGQALAREPLFEQGDADAPGDVVADTTRFHELLDPGELVEMAEGIRRMISVEAAA